GVLLYQLLTGSTPFPHLQLHSATYTEMLRIIREDEPSRPSTKLSSSRELPAIAFKRNLEPKRLTKMVRGELDWIVMKCLEKVRGRRYETANGLCRDIQHYLKDEPVGARPPSRLYLLGKFLRRHKVGLGFFTLALATALLVIWLRYDTVAKERDLTQSHNASLAIERDLTRSQRDEAIRQEGIAKEMAEEAKESLRLAQSVMAQFAVTLQSPLAQGYIQAASRKEEQQVAGQLQAEAPGLAGLVPLRAERARTSGRLGEFLAESGPTPEAVRQFEEVRAMLEPLVKKQPEVAAYQRALATTYNNLGSLYRDEGRAAPAEKAYRRAMEIRQRLIQA